MNDIFTRVAALECTAHGGTRTLPGERRMTTDCRLSGGNPADKPVKHFILPLSTHATIQEQVGCFKLLGQE